MKKYNFKDYISLNRWISYYYQIDTVEKLSAKNILEIGLGSRIVYSALKEIGRRVTGFDNNAELCPDALGDLRDITGIFKPCQFDCVCCFQVLEHFPFCDFEGILKKLAYISSKYVVISLPYAGYTLGFEFRLSRVGDRALNFVFRIPRFWNKHVFDGVHYWEVGKRGYPLSKIENIISRDYILKEKKFIRPNNAMIIFTLEKK